ncbi:MULTISPECIES: type II toxin-antitoxin system YhaV family toxin [unclassified Pseudoalteromonas]|uniref:type II toxin-antitoxin system YhaV family toxin n=1 Tax=unclassified Pseudoalteromonas TaxID=194690 RepID=UPI0030151496
MVVNGWTLYTHPLFSEQYLELKAQVEDLKEKDPTGYVKKNATKRLAAIQKLIFQVIPQDPASPDFRQGSTLGSDNKHWFRAKFFQQYRLFFRYHLESKVIVYAWVNDEKNKRAYGSKTDAYKVFEKMLKSGNPPEGWDDLLKAAKDETLSP